MPCGYSRVLRWRRRWEEARQEGCQPGKQMGFFLGKIADNPWSLQMRRLTNCFPPLTGRYRIQSDRRQHRKDQQKNQSDLWRDIRFFIIRLRQLSPRPATALRSCFMFQSLSPVQHTMSKSIRWGTFFSCSSAGLRKSRVAFKIRLSFSVQSCRTDRQHYPDLTIFKLFCLFCEPIKSKCLILKLKLQVSLPFRALSSGASIES